MSTIKSAVAMGLVAASSAFAVQGSPRGLAFAGPALPQAAAQGHVLKSQRQPALRQAKARSLKMIDEVLIQGGLAAAAGLGVAVGGIYFIEKKAAMGAETGQLSQEQVNKFAMEGSEAENKFSGSDQTLDDLIAAMETAQGVKKEEKPKVAAKQVAEDDGW